MPDSIADIARRLAENAEAVCRHYLSNGRRAGRYWLVGDVHNTPGRSLYVRLSGSASGDAAPPASWTDAATIGAWRPARSDRRRPRPGRHRRGAGRGPAVSRAWPRGGATIMPTRAVVPADLPGEGSRAEPRWPPSRPEQPKPHADCSRCQSRSPARSPAPICGNAASAVTPDMTALRFHPRCWYRPEADSPERRPRRLAGADRGGHRPARHRHRRAAHLARPVRAAARRRSACRGGRWATCSATRSASAPADDVMAAGEGIETMLSLRTDPARSAAGRRAVGRASRRPCCFRPDCAGSTSFATTIRPGGARGDVDGTGAGRGDRGADPGAGPGTSTTTCGSLGPDALAAVGPGAARPGGRDPLLAAPEPAARGSAESWSGSRLRKAAVSAACSGWRAAPLAF